VREAVTLLLGATRDVDAVMRDGATALYVAAQEGSLPQLRLLLAAGAHKER
jgi:ankyrin repeat protein